jgi:RimJ/RimL family protein N-acetyltransferase
MDEARAESSTSAAAAYPAELERAIAGPDGAALRLRPIRPDDAPRLVELYGRLSQHTAYQRFFTVMKRLPPDWARFLAAVDYRRRLALVVEDPRDAALIAVARYEPTERADTAEVAFVVVDAWQGRGIGRRLLDELLSAAEARGVRRFRAYVLADNARMLRLLRGHTRVDEGRLDAGVVELTFRRRRAEAPARDPSPREEHA